MIRIIAMVLVGTGVWMLIGLGPSYMNLGAALRDVIGFAGTGAAILLAGQLLAPVLKIVTGLGLFTLRRWGRSSALVALGLDIVTLGVSIQRFYGFRGAGPFHSPEGVVGGTVVQESSILPVLVICVLSLLCFVLMSSAVFRRRWAHLMEAA